jgi:hypothetical protein
LRGPYRSRKFQTRDTLKHLVIVCEGERTEVIYFNHYRSRGSGVILEVFSDRKNDPVGLVGRALKRIEDPRDPLDIMGGDAIWCVLDADDHAQKKVDQAVKLADGKVRLALSAPCFELWFILHFNIPSGRMTPGEAIGFLKSYIPGYCKDLDVFDVLEPKRRTAIKNASTLARGKDPDHPCVDDNPLTMVHVLVGEILDMHKRNRSRK